MSNLIEICGLLLVAWKMIVARAFNPLLKLKAVYRFL